MADKNFYDILGVSRGASDDEIKAAYRRLARKLHPDVNKAPDAQARFTEVQEAYDVLSDPEKRRLYDRTGRVGVGAAGVAGAATGPGGGGVHHGFTVDFEDLDDLGSVFDSFFGGRAGFSTQSRRTRPHRPPRRGNDLRQTVHVRLEDIAHGTTLRTTTPSGDHVEVKIPAGCADRTTLRLKGRGAPSPSPGGPNGDLLIAVHVEPHPLFTRGRPNEPDPKSADLSITLPVTIAEATLGATVDVPTLEGPVRLTIPPGTSSGRRLRLKGRGLPGKGGARGDLYTLIRIVPPDPASLDEDERRTLERLGGRQPSPRAAMEAYSAERR